MKIFGGRPVEPGIPDMTAEGRDAAVTRSAGCPHCGGNGLAIVDATEAGSRPMACGATCVCLHGRWIRAWHVGKGTRLMERIPDLAGILAGTDRRWRHVTGGIEEQDVDHQAEARAAIRKHFGGAR